MASAICASPGAPAHERRIDGIDGDELAQAARSHGSMAIDARTSAQTVSCRDGLSRPRGGDHGRVVRHRPGVRRSCWRATASPSSSARGARIGCEEAVGAIEAAGGRAVARTMDVTANDDVERLVAARARGVRTPRHDDLQCRLRLLRHARGHAARHHAADDGRELHGHVLRRAGGAAGLPPHSTAAT